MSKRYIGKYWLAYTPVVGELLDLLDWNRPGARQPTLPASHPISLRSRLSSTALPSIAQRGRQFARIGPNQLIRPHRDGLGTFGVVMQRKNWLIAQICLVYLDEPDEPTHEEDDLLKKNLTN